MNIETHTRHRDDDNDNDNADVLFNPHRGVLVICFRLCRRQFFLHVEQPNAELSQQVSLLFLHQRRSRRLHLLDVLDDLLVGGADRGHFPLGLI